MAVIGIPARSSDDWDVPATQVAADVKALAERRLAAGVAAEMRHLVDPLEDALAHLAIDHPDRIPSSDWTPGSPA